MKKLKMEMLGFVLLLLLSNTTVIVPNANIIIALCLTMRLILNLNEVYVLVWRFFLFWLSLVTAALTHALENIGKPLYLS